MFSFKHRSISLSVAVLVVLNPFFPHFVTWKPKTPVCPRPSCIVKWKENNSWVSKHEKMYLLCQYCVFFPSRFSIRFRPGIWLGRYSMFMLLIWNLLLNLGLFPAQTHHYSATTVFHSGNGVFGVKRIVLILAAFINQTQFDSVNLSFFLF